MRKCWLTGFSPFPTMLSRGFFLEVVKPQGCVRKGCLQILSIVTALKIIIYQPFLSNNYGSVHVKINTVCKKELNMKKLSKLGNNKYCH